MRIDRLKIRNFKRFKELKLGLHPKFTLLVGDNGSGKTSILDALAIAAGVWLVKKPDTTLDGSGRNILHNEIRLEAKQDGDRIRFIEHTPVSIKAQGLIAGQEVEWCRKIREGGSRTTNTDAKKAIDIVQTVFKRCEAGENVLCPVLAYYGAGRAWLPSQERKIKARNGNNPLRRWDAFYDCFAERIRLGDLQDWFQREAIAFANRGGHWRPGYHAVKEAILGCIPGADELRYDGDRKEIILSIAGQAQPLTNLSAGWTMMLALVADIATKAVTQNAQMLPEDMPSSQSEDPSSWQRVLQETPGLVLIDEIDAHLHPKWQQRVVADLKETFPEIQFVATSHSPFVIQSLQDGELKNLEEYAPAEYANHSIEDIAEYIQGVKIPQQSQHATELAKATERYFELLQSSDDPESPEVQQAEAEYRQKAERFSTSPDLSVFLKLEALAKIKEGKE